ncbi:MAG: hypothetical protein ACREQ9_23955 [Candidatus Binatia bacterium]
MELREIAAYRWHVGVALAVLFLVVWYPSAYKPRAGEAEELARRTRTLSAERDQLAHEIAVEEQEIRRVAPVPARVAPALAGRLSAIERLNYFLENITRPANDLDLSYFTVTPQAPVAGASYEEIPFTIAVEGSYAALADYLYQLEYGHDFVVRDLAIARSGEAGVRAEFRLSALLLKDASQAPAPTEKDPGRPTSLELARDPFARPPAKLAVGPGGKSYFLNVPPGLHLSGVMETGGRMVAIINHEPYRVGSTIDNKRITRIDSRGVELSDQARTYFLEMEQPRSAAAAHSEEAHRP